MLRFCEKRLVDQNDGLVTNVVGKIRFFDEGIWQKGKEKFRQVRDQDSAILQMVSVLDEQERICCYGWQDTEANRELRMLRELEEARSATLFREIFPDIKEVVVCGCNELAYFFVKYLERYNIPVSVFGKYWENLGYQSTGDIDIDADRMIIMAEPVLNGKTDLFQKIVRSASPYFECIDQIYEANVLAGKIKDIRGGFEWVLEQLKGKKVVILGTDERAQDAYDLLYQKGIDIWCFVERKRKDCDAWYVPEILLGKRVCTVWETFDFGKDVVFVSADGGKSALGTAEVEFFDYYGYRRNEQFFLLNDYVDIPYSNLVHILNGKEILLAGDGILCDILSEYLEKVERGNISVRYTELSQWNVSHGSDKILFIVYPWYGIVDAENTPELWKFREQLKKLKNISCSEYFSRTGAFVLIDAYMNQHREKYTYECIIPKEILLGAIPGGSGNFLMRGLMDGHSNILQILYDEGFDSVNNNMFWYCTCLAWERNNRKPEGRSDESGTFLPEYESFKNDIEKMQILNDKMTSQEIFLTYHIAYMDREKHMKIGDMSQMIIYWEPHYCPRTETPFLSQWLESEKVGGHILTMRRNNLVWYGSLYKMSTSGSRTKPNYWVINCMTGQDIRAGYLSSYWKELVVRLEDLKLHPKTELLKLCEELEIPWSDNMMHTTKNGCEWSYYSEGTVDFDVKPVFNSYEEFLSEFDRFRISIVSAPYQKRYGYIYEDCLKFTRSELQEMFLKEFRFHGLLQFETDEDRIVYYLYMHHFFENVLWKARRHAVLDDVVAEFDDVEIGRTAEEEQRRKGEALKGLIEFVRKQNKLIFYGIGNDCAGLWKCLDNTDREKIIFCDQRASRNECVYQGKKVLTPQELQDGYHDYKILVTSSQFYQSIQRELENRGIDRNRIRCNTVPLW